jgi:hypothetical protein
VFDSHENLPFVVESLIRKYCSDCASVQISSLASGGATEQQEEEEENSLRRGKPRTISFTYTLFILLFGWSIRFYSFGVCDRAHSHALADSQPALLLNDDNATEFEDQMDLDVERNRRLMAEIANVKVFAIRFSSLD